MGVLFRRYEGPIEVGDRFEWCPYGHEGWPKSWESVVVIASGEDGVQTVDRRGKRVWNETDHFREMVKKVEGPA